MTIKQQGGIFGRNPTFNNVDVEGTLTTDTFTAASVTTESISTVNTDATLMRPVLGHLFSPLAVYLQKYETTAMAVFLG